MSKVCKTKNKKDNLVEVVFLPVEIFIALYMCTEMEQLSKGIRNIRSHISQCWNEKS